MIRICTFYLVALLITQSNCDYVGQSVSGEVEEGNYTYYTLRQTGHVLMVLTSLTGDADLYISDATNDRPTFMFEEHELSSTTCGVDTVDIPASFARPVHIAVYGHPNYPHSKFNLDGVIIEEDEFDHFAQGSYGESDGEEVKKDQGKSRDDDYDDGLPDYLKEGSPLRIVLSILGSILQIVLEILI